jgi:glycosyltransferase involved in cell wall biosynthesis
MTISYQILCKNEDSSLETLLDFLVTHKREVDEINVCRDSLGENPKTIETVDKFKNQINYFEREITHTIHNQKNWLAEQASGDYLFYLDADELLYKEFIGALPTIIESNPEVDIYFLPRINIVKGVTQEYINERGWKVNEKGWINFPDVQDRLFKRNKGIKYREIPHGRLVNEGKKYSLLPTEELYSIIHIKSFEKQTSDNNWHDNKEKELGLR